MLISFAFGLVFAILILSVHNLSHTEHHHGGMMDHGHDHDHGPIAHLISQTKNLLLY